MCYLFELKLSEPVRESLSSRSLCRSGQQRSREWLNCGSGSQSEDPADPDQVGNMSKK